MGANRDRLCHHGYSAPPRHSRTLCCTWRGTPNRSGINWNDGFTGKRFASALLQCSSAMESTEAEKLERVLRIFCCWQCLAKPCVRFRGLTELRCQPCDPVVAVFVVNRWQLDYRQPGRFTFAVCHHHPALYFFALLARHPIVHALAVPEWPCTRHAEPLFVWDAGCYAWDGRQVFNMVRETGDHGPYNSWYVLNLKHE
jgi:hypothetical protein